MIVRYSPAKINLILDVLKKRDDGYHDIASLMQKISLCDAMKFSPRKAGIAVRCPGSDLPEDAENIVYKAAEALFKYTSCSSGVEITIEKSIPIAAGLGGGSSNAATTLSVLNEIFDLRCTQAELMHIGSEIGADVPFFVFDQPAAWAFGIGDQLQPVEKIPSLWFVLVNPGFEVSTRMVYENLKLGLTKNAIQYNSMPYFETAAEIVKALRNDLELVSLSFYPVLSEIKALLVKKGALGSLMSGSGPTVFGIFDREESARRAKDDLREWRECAFVVRSL